MTALNRKALKDATMAKVRAVEEVLRLWDPINVAPGAVAPLDEYDSYAPHIVSMVEGGCTSDELASHLERLCVQCMGLGPSSAESRSHSLTFAEQIVDRLRPGNSL
jgi:hypothetical protein